MALCLPKESVQKFVKALKEGTIDPAKLSVMSSADRHAFFEKIVGKEDAKDVNSLYESKLLLKDQKRGLVSWAKQVAGISEARRQDLLARIERLNTVLTPETEKSFYQDLASTRLGTDVTIEEARQIASYSKEAQDAKESIQPDDPIGSKSRLDFGAAKVKLFNYVSELKLSNEAKTFKQQAAEFKKAPVKSAIDSVSDIAGLAKGIKASLDDSAIFRQGWKTLFTDPATWAKNTSDTFSNIYKQLKLKPSDSRVLDAIKADIYSRPNALNGFYSKMKLDVAIDNEEAFPTALPEKIPLFGRLYKASETAYQGFLYRMRADIADKYIAIAEQNGINLKDPLEIESIGRLVNSLTGRGNLGAFEKVGKQINTLFFSPKSVKASLDFLTLHATDKMSTFARKQAAINLLKVATGMAVILGTAKAIQPNSVELDPRSSDFGKIRVGDTRFDVSGGMASLMTLAARLATMSSKSSTSGKITSLNSGKYGAPNGSDVFVNFLENKLSPAASVVKDLLKGKDFSGNKPTLANEAQNLFVPLPITNTQELLTNPNSANPLLASIADALGIATNTYSPKKK